MRLSFVQISAFVSDWKRLRLSDEDLQAMELLLDTNPLKGAVMAGTGGLRKVRFAPPSWATGKSGATRVCYVYFPRHGLVYLVTLFGKNEKANLSPAERKAAAKLVTRLRESLGEGGGHG